MNYWIVKTEPTSYSIDHLKRDKKIAWEGVRNYQARNFMQAMRKGDLVLVYHSSADPLAVVGIAKVTKEATPDQSQFDKKDHHFDPKATKEKPIWYCAEIGFVKKFKEPMSLAVIKSDPALKGIGLAQRGLRLSVLPVSEKHFRHIEKIGS